MENCQETVKTVRSGINESFMLKWGSRSRWSTCFWWL